MSGEVKTVIIVLLLILLIGAGILLKSEHIGFVVRDQAARRSIDSLTAESRALSVILEARTKTLDSLARCRGIHPHTVIPDSSPQGLQAEIDKRFPR